MYLCAVSNNNQQDKNTQAFSNATNAAFQSPDDSYINITINRHILMSAYIRGDHDFFIAYTMFCATKDPSYFCNTTEYYSTITQDNTTDPTQQHDQVEPVVADIINSYTSSPPPSLLPPRSLSTSASPPSSSPDVADEPPRCMRCRIFLNLDDADAS